MLKMIHFSSDLQLGIMSVVRIVRVLVLTTIFVGCYADLYMHNPRGSNNRLNEKSATRAENNRMFDSQNNNRGGYNVGDKYEEPAEDQNGQYRMNFFQSGKYLTQTAPAGRSNLVIEWTNQHGCGGNEDSDPHKQNCNIVIQMMCQDDSSSATADDGITIRDGFSTDKQDYEKVTATTKAEFETQKNTDTSADRGLQEPWFWYDACNRRQRNKGLFTADQNLNNEEAISTRQNPNGGRSGYECPEERDYYPYWHPTPFIDIAVLAQNESLCSYYQEHSFNRKPKYECVESFSNNERKHFSTYNDKQSCQSNGGVWTEFYNMLELAPQYTSRSQCQRNHGDGLTYKWGKPWDPKKIDQYQQITDVCFVLPQPVECQTAGWTRSNHLGNGRDGYPLNFTWTIPYFPSAQTKRCVLRMRYNISTDDYDPYSTDSSDNNDDSIIEDDPKVQVGANGQLLQLALDTTQTGRTFQDRSHAFTLSPRPSGISNSDHLHNLNVRGKRGNIVQTFPAVEYDFVPNRLEMGLNHLIHIQWTGSNTHNNAAPAGDGQAGSAGEGRAGTDRHNMLQTLSANQNYPVPQHMMNMFKDASVVWTSNGEVRNKENVELFLASSGYYACIDANQCSRAVMNTTLATMSSILDNANASFEGVVLKFQKEGIFYYICSRNNNFTNRSQKGHLIVK